MEAVNRNGRRRDSALSTPRTTRRHLMASTTIQERSLSDEVRRAVLREALERYRCELLGDEERQLLLDRIKRLRRALGL
jgi:hypothetical protein